MIWDTGKTEHICSLFLLFPTQNAKRQTTTTEYGGFCFLERRGLNEGKSDSNFNFCSTNGNSNVLAQRKMVAFFLFTLLFYHYSTYHFAKPTESFIFIGFGNLALTKRVLFLHFCFSNRF